MTKNSTDSFYQPLKQYKVGDKVLDELTGKIVTIRSINIENGNIGYWVDSEYLGGGRHPWELSSLSKE